jgi:hypothetical protein
VAGCGLPRQTLRAPTCPSATVATTDLGMRHCYVRKSNFFDSLARLKPGLQGRVRPRKRARGLRTRCASTELDACCRSLHVGVQLTGVNAEVNFEPVAI